MANWGLNWRNLKPRTKMKKRTNWRPDFESDAFWRQFPFKWKCMFWENGVVSYISKKEKEKRRINGVVLNGTISLLLPLDAKRTVEEEDFSPLLCLLPFSLKPPKRRRQNLPLACHMVEEQGMHPRAAAQWAHRPPYRKKKEEKNKGRKEKKTQRSRGEREKDRHRHFTATS